MNVADCPGKRFVVEPAHDPVGLASDWQEGPVVRAPAGGDATSVMLTALSETFPVFLATKV
jgi:hypothetical protein